MYVGYNTEVRLHGNANIFKFPLQLETSCWCRTFFFFCTNLVFLKHIDLFP